MHPLITSNKKKFTVLSSLWVALLFGLALLPGSFCLKVLREENMFSLAHFGAYVILGFIVALALQFHRTRFWNLIWITLLINAVVGAGTELIQIYSSDRVPSWEDFYCDMGGAFVGLFCFLLFKQFLKNISFVSAFTLFLKPREKAN